MALHLSHTAKELYLRCPFAYYIQYVMKLREKTVSSALPFGTAMDAAITELLSTNVDNALRKFEETWLNPEVNGQKVNLLDAKQKLVTFYKSDTDEDLFEVNEKAAPVESMLRKGKMLIAAYNEEIVPNIKEVLGMQVPIRLENGAGDVITGYIDLIAKWIDDRRIIFDNKTSSQPYATDIITTEAKQLAIYDEAAKEEYGTEAVGYIVMEKKIRKKAPRTRIQTLIDVVPRSLTEKTIDEFDQVLYSIKMARFESNHPNCDTYYGKCPCKDFMDSGGTNYDKFVYTGK